MYDTYLADMFTLLSEGNNIVSVAKDTDDSLKCTVVTANKKFGFVHLVEAKRSSHVIGDVVSVAVKAKALPSGLAPRGPQLDRHGRRGHLRGDFILGAVGVEPTWAANWTREGTVGSLALSGTYATGKGENLAIDTASAK